MTTKQSGSQTGEKYQEPFSVLITGAGSPGAVGIIRYLRKFCRVVAVDMGQFASGFRFANMFYNVPPADSKDFIPKLITICQIEKIRVLLPKVTAELPYLSKHRKDFEKIGTVVLVSEPSALKTANNKLLLYEKMEKAVLVPKYLYAENRFCSKPIVGNGGKGFKEYNADKELIMEYIPGDEYSVDVLANQGEAITIVPRVREKVKAGVSIEGTVIMDKEIIELSKIIVKKLKLHGIAGLQFKRNKDFKPVLIECNPRIQGTIMLSETAGANILTNALNLALNQQLIVPEIREGTKMFRFWQEIYE